MSTRHSTTTAHDHGHSHGLVHDSIERSRAGVRAVLVSLGVLELAAVAQTLIFALTGSVALLADLIHNFGDALTAVPLGIAFVMRSERAERAERGAGLFVVAAIFVSACVAGVEAVQRLIHQSPPDHRPGDNRRHPAHHLAVVGHGSRPRPSALSQL